MLENVANILGWLGHWSGWILGNRQKGVWVEARKFGNSEMNYVVKILSVKVVRDYGLVFLSHSVSSSKNLKSLPTLRML